MPGQQVVSVLHTVCQACVEPRNLSDSEEISSACAESYMFHETYTREIPSEEQKDIMRHIKIYVEMLVSTEPGPLRQC
jgi:hypothetical protein